MDVTVGLVRLGSLATTLVGVVALAVLFRGIAADEVPAVGPLATAALLAVATLAAVAWGRRTARVRRETPYW